MPYNPLVEIQKDNGRTLFINPEKIVSIEEDNDGDFWIESSGPSRSLTKNEAIQLFKKAYNVELVLIDKTT